MSEIWEKFVFLVGLSATTATIRQPIGTIRSNPQARGFLLDVMRETVNVGRARGLALPEDYADKRLEFCDTLPAEMTASMYQDILRGNRLELPWLSGSVADLGEQLGIAVPRNRAVTDILALYVAGQKSN
jgi:2-dehydropantoate 2-reductase